MLQLAREILDITGSKSKIVYLPLPEDDPVQRQPDIRLAREKLGGWEPSVPLREGLVQTIQYFDKLLAEGT
jgi:UDP-glucuronate decarboxylase